MNKCQHCKTEDLNHFVEGHEMMGINLCMRCTDKLLSMINGRDVNEFWKDEYAERHGFPKFELPSPYNLEYLRKRIDLMMPVKQLDYSYRKGYDL